MYKNFDEVLEEVRVDMLQDVGNLVENHQSGEQIPLEASELVKWSAIIKHSEEFKGFLSALIPLLISMGPGPMIDNVAVYMFIAGVRWGRSEALEGMGGVKSE